MEIVIRAILQQIITQCAGTQDIIEKLAACDPCGRKNGLKTVAFLLRLSIYHGLCWLMNVPDEISNNVVCATNKASDQPAQTCSLIGAFVSRLNIL